MTEPSNAPVMPDDWPAQAAERVEGLVGTVRDKTTGPVMTAARWLVYGTLILIVGIGAVILLTTLLMRLLHSYLPFDDATNVWVSYLVLGTVCTGAGVVMLAQARQPDKAQK